MLALHCGVQLQIPQAKNRELSEKTHYLHTQPDSAMKFHACLVLSALKRTASMRPMVCTFNDGISTKHTCQR